MKKFNGVQPSEDIFVRPKLKILCKMQRICNEHPCNEIAFVAHHLLFPYFASPFFPRRLRTSVRLKITISKKRFQNHQRVRSAERSFFPQSSQSWPGP